MLNLFNKVNYVAKILNNRRIKIIKFALINQNRGGSIVSFIKNVFSPNCSILANLQINHINKYNEYFNKIIFKKYNKPLFFPHGVKTRQILQVITEQFYSWQWHYYEFNNTKVDPEDTVIDCGAAEGIFSYLICDRAKKVICIEPLPEFLASLNKTFEDQSNVFIIPVALGNKNESLYIHKSGTCSTITTTKTDYPINVMTLDSLSKELNIIPTYIKGDLEGFERYVIEGATNVIKTYKPKIAITTYHRSDDADVLMGILKDLNPNYSFQLKGIEERAGAPVMLHAW